MNSTKKKREAVKAPAEDDWNAHKELLRGLYFNSTLTKLMEHMERNFDFLASKNQYERKFKDWNFRKNLSCEEWEHVLRKKRQRDEDNKETRVVLHGVEIPKKRLKKEQSRYTLSDLNRIFSSYPSAPSPEGISVATPPPALVDLYMRSIRIDNLPSFGLESLFAIQPSSRQRSSSRKDTLLQSHFSSTSKPPLSAPSMAASSIAELLGDLNNLSTVSTVESHMVVQQFRNATIEKYEGETEKRIAKLFGSSSTSALEEFMTFVAQFGSNNMLGWSQTVKILVWISEQNQTFLENLIELKDPTIQACLETLIVESKWGHYKPALTALSSADKNRHLYHGRRENLLYAAIELDLTHVVKTLVDEGVDVNRKVYRYNLDNHLVPSTLLGAASSIDIVNILIIAGADVNAAIHDKIEGAAKFQDDTLYYSPIYHAVHDGKLDYFQRFLDAGAHFDLSDIGVLGDSQPNSFLAFAIQERSLEMVKMLLGLGAECSGFLRKFWNGYIVRARTELQQACYMGEADIVRALLAIRARRDVLQTGRYRWGALRDAAMQGHLDVVELLIAAGADVNANSQDTREPEDKEQGSEHESEKSEDEDEESEDYYLKHDVQLIPSTPLMAAVEGGHIEVIKSLLRHGADVNAPAEGVYGRNVLAVAETFQSHDVAKVLREAGASSQRGVRESIVEIQVAAAQKDLRKVQGILAFGVDASHILDTSKAILDRAGRNSGDLLSTFVAVCGSKVNFRGPETKRCALEIAINLGDVPLIQELGEAGANFKQKTSDGLSLLQWALAKPNGSTFELLDCLVLHGASVYSQATSTIMLGRVKSPLEIAATKYDHRTLELLLLSGVYQSRAACTGAALCEAARNRKLNISSIRLLLNHGADANAADRYSTTALICAVSYQWIECVRLLLDRGADINALGLNDRGRTALQQAAGLGTIEVVKLLLDRGADINAVPARVYGRTALQAAIDQDSPDSEMIQMLIDHGADINAPAAMERGITALQAAAMKSYLKIALQLLEMGADPNAPGSPEEGRTALEGAAEHGRLDMVQLLLNAGAEPTQSAIDFAEKERRFVVADMIKAALKEKEANEQGKDKGKEVERGASNERQYAR